MTPPGEGMRDEAEKLAECLWCFAGRRAFPPGCCGRTAWHHHTYVQVRPGEIRTLPNDDCPLSPSQPADKEREG